MPVALAVAWTCALGSTPRDVSVTLPLLAPRHARAFTVTAKLNVARTATARKKLLRLPPRPVHGRSRHRATGKTGCKTDCERRLRPKLNLAGDQGGLAGYTLPGAVLANPGVGESSAPRERPAFFQTFVAVRAVHNGGIA